MRAVLQRVSQASVTVDEKIVGEIGAGLLVLLGVEPDDGDEQIRWMADKSVDLRIFEDDEGKMNRSLVETGGAMLVVSQFTLLGDCRKGRRPSFVCAAPPEHAEQLYDEFVAHVRQRNIEVATGIFRAHMDVALVNDGPVTMLLNTT